MADELSWIRLDERENEQLAQTVARVAEARPPQAVLLYEAQREARVAWEVAAMSRWLDCEPAWRGVRAGVLERWSHG